VAPSHRTRGNGHKLKYRIFLLNITEHFDSEGDPVLAQIAQRCCGVSVLGDNAKAIWTQS